VSEYPGIKDFLDSSPTAFHAAESISVALEKNGYKKLDETQNWELESGRGYYIIRDGRGVIAFIPGGKAPEASGFRIAAAHLDSPVMKLKTEGISWDKGAWKLPVEPYGTPVFQSWMDRELEIAGMVTCRDSSKTWRSGLPTAVIPSLAIHLNKEVNKGVELNAQTHMTALMPGIEDNTGTNPLLSRIFTDLKISPDDYLASELYLVPVAPASFTGSEGSQLIVSGRLDNLAMSHAVLASLPEPENIGDAGLIALWFDAEEVGSRTTAGAASLFPGEIIERIVLSFGGGREELFRARRNSFLVSADMAHAVHPNFSDRHDPSYSPLMGSGPVLKSHGQKHYATDVYSESRVLEAAERAGVQMQKLIFRSDLPCGFTVGPISSAGLSISAVDIGNPLWAMHSSRETASISDHNSMIKLLVECWKS